MSDSARDLPTPTLLETGLPVTELSRVVAADRRARDPIYLAHRWFARRPPALLRGLLLAAALEPGTSDIEFWAHYADGQSNALSGRTVFDPFHGGGTTLIEAGRLGAHVAGRDVDPVATRLVRHELRELTLADFDDAAKKLIAYLTNEFAHLYPARPEFEPLHYFSAATATCPACETSGLMYRNLVLARGVKRNGSVARAPELLVFCPDCTHPRSLPLDQTIFTCCGKTHSIGQGTWERNRWTCPTCNGRFTHSQLSTGQAPRTIVGVEGTTDNECRTIRPASDQDAKSDDLAALYIHKHSNLLHLPTGSVAFDPHDSRPASFGIENFRDMFTNRQLAVFGAAFAWVRKADTSEVVRDALLLAVSNALASNNRMCGYATDYGRLAALFSVRGYSLPILAVELNPLHPKAGRGTLSRTIERVRASTKTTVRRYVWSTSKQFPEPVVHEHRRDANPQVIAGSATETNRQDLGSETYPADLIITDPPYFNYISYDRLSSFYRAWFSEDEIKGDPVLPDHKDPRQSFGLGLGAALAKASSILASHGILAFTYHSSSRIAWEAVALALDEAKLRVTALWPVLSDPHMGHHGTSGACQYDIVIVTRPVAQTEPAEPPHGLEGGHSWLGSLGLTLPKPDYDCALLAYEILGPRWATLPVDTNQQGPSPAPARGDQ